ncbi:MAG: DNA-binding domain-containing protein [Pseudomonadota bacterium]
MAAERLLADSQHEFISALTHAEAPVPDDLTDRPVKRFNVYRNNVRTSLIGAVSAQFPVCKRLVGQAFFDAMAAVFVTSHPPKTRVLMQYGNTFAAFVRGFAPARSVPYLGDIAALEWAHSQSYHAADARALQPEDFAAVPPEAWAGARFELHPAVRWVRSAWPVLSIWHTNTHDAEVNRIPLDQGGEDVLITRPDLDVTLRTVPPGGLAFVERIAQGATLEGAATAAGAAAESFDLAANLSGLIGAGALIGFRLATQQDIGQDIDPHHAGPHGPRTEEH